MPRDNIIVGIDVASTKIAVCVGQVDEGITNIIGFSRVPNTGLRKGIVTDLEDTISSLSMALEEAERMSGVSIKNATVNIGGMQISSTVSKGVVAVSRADGEVTQHDVQRVLDAARTVALPPNREILHVIPKFFTVYSQQNINDPVGMTGIRLEVEALVVGGASAAIKNLTKCLQQSGININELIFSPLASEKVLLTKKQKELGVLLFDFGGGTISLAVYENGDVCHCAVIPVGSMHITNDIAIGLRTSLELAEKIKIKYGSALPENISESEMINLNQFDPQDTQKIERKYVAEIIHARLFEIFSLAREELKKIGKDGMLPAGVVFTGGGAKLEGLITLAKEELRLPAQIGLASMDFGTIVDKIDDPSYSTSVGLMLEAGEHRGKSTFTFDGNNVIDKARGFFKQFLP